MGYIDFKITTRERMWFDDKDLYKIKEIITKNEFHPLDLWDDHIIYNTETLSDRVKYMTVEDNKGLNTIKMYNDNGILVYQNGDEENYGIEE